MSDQPFDLNFSIFQSKVLPTIYFVQIYACIRRDVDFGIYF